MVGCKFSILYFPTTGIVDLSLRRIRRNLHTTRDAFHTVMYSTSPFKLFEKTVLLLQARLTMDYTTIIMLF